MKHDRSFQSIGRIGSIDFPLAETDEQRAEKLNAHIGSTRIYKNRVFICDYWKIEHGVVKLHWVWRDGTEQDPDVTIKPF